MKAFHTYSAIALLLLSSCMAAAQHVSYDAVRDFSIQSNPNGVWSYGWTWPPSLLESSFQPTPLSLYTVTDTISVPGMSAWLAAGVYYANPPYIAHNDTNDEICRATFCIPPTYLHLHPGYHGQRTVLRWTAPFAGRFTVQGAFEGLDWAGPTTTDVHVLLNSAPLVSGAISSYMQPLTFNLQVEVSSGDTIDFAVGLGGNGSYFYDSTGVQAVIFPVAEN